MGLGFPELGFPSLVSTILLFWRDFPLVTIGARISWLGGWGNLPLITVGTNIFWLVGCGSLPLVGKLLLSMLMLFGWMGGKVQCVRNVPAFCLLFV